MNQKEIQLPLKIVQRLLQHAQTSTEIEVCGLISHIEGKVKSSYCITNSNPHPQNKFSLDVAEQISTFKLFREQGEKLFAIYHSHPHSDAYPSATDLALANYPDVLYLIISLNTKGVLELRGFNLINNKAEEVTLQLHS